MKRITYILILFSSVCYGQDYYVPHSGMHTQNYTRSRDTLNKKNYFFSINIGLSLPLRDFGSRDTARDFMIIGPDSTHGKGFANLGFHGALDGGVFLSKNYGLLAKISFNENSFDENNLNAIINGNYDYAINGNFSIWQFMGGGFANFQVDKNSWVWIEGMVGLIHANFPSFSIYNLPATLAPPNLNVFWNFSFPDANDVTYSLSVGFEKSISKNVSFITTLCYSGAELSYPTLTYTLTSPYIVPIPPYTQHTPVTMPYGSFDFSLGLLFHL